MPNKRIWSDEGLRDVVQHSSCIADVIRQLGFKSLGRNYDTIKSAIKRLGIDISHFNKKLVTARSITYRTEESVFVHGEIVKKHLLKRFLMKYVPYKCFECGVESIYNDKLIVLQLHHIDGNKLNNLRTNLRFLCPNCHSQTDTFCGRNSLEKVYGNFCKECGLRCKNKFCSQKCSGKFIIKGVNINRIATPKIFQSKIIVCNNNCKECGVLCKSQFCSQKCSGKFHYKINGIVNSNNNPKINWPDVNVLKEQILSGGYTAVSKKLGVSLTAIKKHLKIRGVTIPAYWTQRNLY